MNLSPNALYVFRAHDANDALNRPSLTTAYCLESTLRIFLPAHLEGTLAELLPLRTGREMRARIELKFPSTCLDAKHFKHDEAVLKYKSEILCQL